MAQYPLAPPLGVLDTCYDFTSLSEISVPTIALRFAGGMSLDLGIRQKMYFQRRDNVSLGCLAFATPAWEFPPGIAMVIGTLAQEMTEVVYDVSCGEGWVRPHPMRLITSTPTQFTFVASM
jgi:hypothetical protein